MFRKIFMTAFLIGSGAASAACPSDSDIETYVKDWSALRPAKAIPVADMADATCARNKVVRALTASLGRPVGYKAGLTAKPVQERFGATAPVAGVLLERMILPSGAAVPAKYGARPVWEADMLLVVKDAAINDAKTAEDILKNISGMRPFIELADLSLAPSEALNGVQLAAINVGARLGVAGPEVPLRADAEMVKRLAEVKILVTDASGATLAENVGAATLGNPLNAALWLVEDLKKTGGALKAGDIVSVGSFSPLTPPKPGLSVTVKYIGIEGDPTVSVSFQ